MRSVLDAKSQRRGSLEALLGIGGAAGEERL